MIDLAADFPAPTYDDWMDQVGSVLMRGRADATPDTVATAFAQRLVRRTEDGFDVQPLYSRDDAIDSGLPGTAPFVRGANAVRTDWEVRQRVWADVDDSDALTELESGATGLLVELGNDPDALRRVLDGVLLDIAPVSLSADDQPGAARLMITLWALSGVSVGDRRGTLGLDPFGRYARSGGAEDLGMAEAVEVAQEATDAAPNVRAMVADGTVFHEAGATAAQEIAWTSLVGAEYVRALMAAGMDLDVALSTVEFRWSVTDDQFGTIAKLRAARRVWARVAELAGAVPADRGQAQHAVTASSMLTVYDPWVNALRSTVACFAAAVGGAAAITVAPHDALHTRGGSALGRRLARNTQSIRLMESHLARVDDIAGGSWYVESLTGQLGEHAWSTIREVEAAGGIVSALRSNRIQDQIDSVLAVRREAVATRARPLTGLTEFPDLNEHHELSIPVVDSPGVEFRPLLPQREGEAVEALRLRADAHAAQTGQRPTVFLATLGTEAEFTPRLTFAQNFLGVAGVGSISGLLAEYDPKVTPLVCLCSSDAVYAADADTAAVELRAAGAQSVYLAGRGMDIDGVDQEIGLGTDVVVVLGTVLDRLEVP